MYNLNEVVRGGTLCFANAGLAIGSTVQKAKILSPDGEGVHYAINGIMYHKADTDDAIVFTGLTQADDTCCLYLVCLNSAGTVSVVQGTAVDRLALAAGSVALQWPTPAANTCPIGAIRIDNDGAAFTGATTGLNAATVTDTYYNLFTVPTTPLTA
jgi:hypothetical protein